MSGKHAVLSPSGAERWMACPGSVALSMGLPSTSSVHADEGTAAHELAAECLRHNVQAINSLGHTLTVCVDHDTGEDIVVWDAVDFKKYAVRNTFAIDEDFAAHVQVYLDFVRNLVDGGELLVEQAMSIEHLTGEEGAEGTGDVVILSPVTKLPGVLKIVDLKFGRGVRKDAKDNPQLMMYAHAAYTEHSLFRDFAEIHLYISQPRLDHISEHIITVDELLAFGEEVRQAARMTVDDLVFTPGETQCRFCKAAGICSAQDDFVQDTVDADFSDLVALDKSHPTGMPLAIPDDVAILNEKMNALDLIEQFCKAVRAKVGVKLFEGATFTDWKLVQGKKGNRAWKDEKEAEALLKKMKLKEAEMYDFSLISPTTAEKLFKSNKIGPRQWPKVLEEITQKDGKPSIEHVSDKRPALVITAVEDDFENMEQIAACVNMNDSVDDLI